MTHNPKVAVELHATSAKRFLMELIRFESTPSNESDAMICARDWFALARCDCHLVPLPENLSQDPEYSHSDECVSYKDRANLVALRKGRGGGRSVILQSHIDVVPAGDWADAFAPREEGHYVIGRGALDAKGQVAAIWLAMKALADMGYETAGDVQVQVVVEEELGGNGALALLRQGWKADAAIILEGTGLQIHPSNRGAIWFRIDIEGLPRHMGRKHEGISAIDLAYKVIGALYEYESRIVADSAGYPGFERYERPVQVNIGVLNAGTWPAMVAANARIEGGVGFLPNRSMEQVKREVREAIESIPDNWLRTHYTLDFPKLHNDSYETDFSHPAIETLHSACKASGLDSDVFGWNVSCDARLYAKVGGMPTIVFGPGSISDAHARDEKIDFREIVKAAEALVRFVVEWCG
jgi:acetylornithine deacetylase